MLIIVVGPSGAGKDTLMARARAAISEAARLNPTLVLEITAPAAVRAARLAARGRETEAVIAARLKREVALPDGVAVARVMNDATPEEGAAAVLAVLRAALSRAESAVRS